MLWDLSPVMYIARNNDKAGYRVVLLRRVYEAWKKEQCEKVGGEDIHLNA